VYGGYCEFAVLIVCNPHTRLLSYVICFEKLCDIVTVVKDLGLADRARCSLYKTR